MEDLEALVAAVLELPRDEVTDDLRRGAHNAWTSGKHIQLIVAVEDFYGLDFTSQEMASVTSLGGLRNLISERTRVADA